MNEETTELRSLLQQAIAERDSAVHNYEALNKVHAHYRRRCDVLEDRIIHLRNALANITHHANKIPLADCCVDKTCHPHFEDGHLVGNCAFQYGVNYGYAILASEAEEALAKDRP